MLVVRAAACAIPAMVARSDAADAIERALHTAFADLRHGDDISATERARLHTQVGAAWVHGEVTPRGTLALLHALGVDDKMRAEEVLIDLGSGTGALVLAAALLRPKLRAVGVELSAERHASACEARSRLAREGGALADAAARVTLIHGDARANGEGAADARIRRECASATVAFVSNLLMEPRLTREIVGNLASERTSPNLRAVALLTPLDNALDDDDDAAFEEAGLLGLESRGRFALETDFDAAQDAFLYVRRRRGKA